MSHDPHKISGCNFHIFDIFDSPVFIINSNGALIFFNSKFQNMISPAPNQRGEIKKLVNLLACQFLIKPFLRSNSVVLKCQIPHSFSAIECANSNLRDVEICKYSLRDNENRLGGYVGIIHDVSNKKPPDLGEGVEKSDRQGPPEKSILTKGEIRILNLIAKGYSTKAIAGILGNSIYTIANHQRSIYKKLSAHSKITAINNGRDFGLLTESIDGRLND
jgi:DNA-binding CsgD family transcriptional regulator